jgi:hypothetical protein
MTLGISLLYRSFYSSGWAGLGWAFSNKVVALLYKARVNYPETKEIPP